MAISVFSGIEIYLTAFGWMLYNALYDTLVQTGVALIPLLGLILGTVIQEAERHGHADAAPAAIHVLRVQLPLMVVVIMFAVVPFANLQMDALRYQCAETRITQGSACAAGGATVGATGTTLDTTNFRELGIQTTTRVPALWYMVMSAGGGLTNAMMRNVPRLHDVEAVSQMLEAAQIEDPVVATEAQRFLSECYVPAVSKLKDLSEQNKLTQAQREAFAANPEDVSWMGSKLLLDTPGLYSECASVNTCGTSLRATGGVPGWAAQPWDTDDAYSHPRPPAGRPNCRDWWLGAGGATGLRDKLVTEGKRAIHGEWGALIAASIEDHMAESVIQAATEAGQPVPTGTFSAAKDMLARMALSNTPNIDLVNRDAAYEASSSSSRDDPYWKATKNLFKNAVGTAGTVIEGTKASFLQHLVIQAAPIVQSTLLLALFALAPIIMVLGRYSLATLGGLLGAYLSIRLWTVLWFVALWLQQTLQPILQRAPTHEGAAGYMFRVFIEEPANGTTSIEFLVDLVIMGLFIALPIVFSAMLTWAGIQGFDKIATAAQNMSDGSAGASGHSGVKAGTSVASAVGGAATSGLDLATTGAASKLGARF